MTDTLVLPSPRARAAGRFAPVLVWVVILAGGAIVQGSGPRRLTGAIVAALVAVTAIQAGLTALCHPLLQASARVRRAAFLIAGAAIAAAPLLIPAEGGVLRFLTACVSVLMIMKLRDVHVHVRTVGPIPRADYLRFLANVFSLVLRKEAVERRPPRRQVLVSLVRSASGAGLALGAVAVMSSVDWRAYPLLVEHALKSLVIFTGILCWLSLTIAVVRLAGGVMRDFSDAPLLARTPADFWRRYNRVFHQYFFENVFRPGLGRRSPAASTMLIFLISGLIHEYVFGVGIGRLQGFQFAFFLIQGAAVAVTFRLRPKRRGAVVAATAATLLFNTVVSMLFFLSFHAIVPLYANPLPPWLQR